MAITYPLALPEPLCFLQDGVSFEPNQFAVINEGAQNPVSDTSDAVWQAAVKSVANVPPASMIAWRNWYRKLKGGFGQFLMTSPDYAAPQAHPDGTNLGTPLVSSVTAATGTIVLKGLVISTTTLTPGDRLQIVYASSSHYAYHEVVEGGTADGSGNLSIVVHEPIFDGIASDDPVTLMAPKFEAFVVPGTFAAPDGIGGVGSFEFMAMQYMRT